MEVIKSGKDNPRITTCPYCGCVISFYPEEADMRYKGLHRAQYGSYRPSENVIACPECGKEVIVETHDSPRGGSKS